MNPADNNEQKLSTEERRKIFKSARQDAYKSEGRVVFWVKYWTAFAVIATFLGIATGLVLSQFIASPSRFSVAIIVAVLFSGFSVGAQIEKWLLRKHIAERLRAG